jgi:hypothetical protein
MQDIIDKKLQLAPNIWWSQSTKIVGNSKTRKENLNYIVKLLMMKSIGIKKCDYSSFNSFTFSSNKLCFSI